MVEKPPWDGSGEKAAENWSGQMQGDPSESPDGKQKVEGDWSKENAGADDKLSCSSTDSTHTSVREEFKKLLREAPGTWKVIESDTEYVINVKLPVDGVRIRVCHYRGEKETQRLEGENKGSIYIFYFDIFLQTLLVEPVVLSRSNWKQEVNDTVERMQYSWRENLKLGGDSSELLSHKCSVGRCKLKKRVQTHLCQQRASSAMLTRSSTGLVSSCEGSGASESTFQAETLAARKDFSYRSNIGDCGVASGAAGGRLLGGAYTAVTGCCGALAGMLGDFQGGSQDGALERLLEGELEGNPALLNLNV